MRPSCVFASLALCVNLSGSWTSDLKVPRGGRPASPTSPSLVHPPAEFRFARCRQVSFAISRSCAFFGVMVPRSSQGRSRSNPGLGAVPKRSLNRNREASRRQSGRVFRSGKFVKCAFFIAFALVVWVHVPLHAQTNCSACWSNSAIHWHGTYHLTVTGSGTDPTCGNPYQVNNSSQGTIDVTNNLGTLSIGSVQGSGTISDTATCGGTLARPPAPDRCCRQE
ncbi:exported hypothetical protein [Verrucomicrobia bacterium]|nr:exported hypothetical protein [Verrucomicrobiota bacterium]